MCRRCLGFLFLLLLLSFFELVQHLFVPYKDFLRFCISFKNPNFQQNNNHQNYFLILLSYFKNNIKHIFYIDVVWKEHKQSGAEDCIFLLGGWHMQWPKFIVNSRTHTHHILSQFLSKPPSTEVLMCSYYWFGY